MRWLLPLMIVLAVPVAPSRGSTVTLVGRVVAVPDGSSVWVHLEALEACYHFSLTGVTPLPCGHPWAWTMHDTLCRLVLGQEVQVKTDGLTNEGEIPGEVFLAGGQSVNSQMTNWVWIASNSNRVQRRPLLTYCPILRLFCGRNSGCCVAVGG